MTYQVKDWQIHFENDRSRERDRCSFVCVPNKQHGMGFSYIMAEKDGAMVYGIWQLIIGACSQQKRPRNGWLTSDGDSGGSPWGCGDLSVKFRRPTSEIKRAIEVLTSERVGWLLAMQVPDSNELPLTPDQLPTNSPPAPLERKGKEEKEEKGKAASLFFVKSFCGEIGIPDSDAEYFWHKCEGSGWINGSKPIKDWKSVLRSWKSAGYLPSQKSPQKQPVKTFVDKDLERLKKEADAI